LVGGLSSLDVAHAPSAIETPMANNIAFSFIV
jgi:hypothetical protein